MVFVGFGCFCEFIVAGTLIKNFHLLITGRLSALGDAGMAMVVLLMFPFGLLILLLPLTVKFVVSPQGLEYHTLAGVFRADWGTTLRLIRYRSHSTGTDVVLIVQYTGYSLRGWTRYAPWDVLRGATDQPIFISQLGRSHGRQVMADILRYAPQLEETAGQLGLIAK